MRDRSRQRRWWAVGLGLGFVGGWAIAEGQDAPRPSGSGATIPVAVRDPEAGHPNVATKKEHCAVAPSALRAIGSAVGGQVRVHRGNNDFAVFTVVETLDATSEGGVAVGKLGRGRLSNQSDPFDGRLGAHRPASELSDDEAKARGEQVERLDDNGAATGLLILAPHGGQLEPPTDQQALRVAERIGRGKAATWRCLGFHPRGGKAAFDRWHITSTDISEASYPLLAKVGARRFRYAVSFHGMAEDRVLVGGSAPSALRVEVRDAIRRKLDGTGVVVDIALPGDANGGKDPRNIVNRYAENGGVQIEQSSRARREHWQAIADAVAEVFAAKL